MKRALQLSLPLGNTWGGKRERAGRRPKGRKPGASHLRRPEHCHRHPLHVTVRVRQGLPTLRSESIFRCVLSQIRAARDRFLRIIHFSVQSNHVHLLVEADDRGQLARGMKGFAVRVARNLNNLLDSRGSIWAQRYHARPLATPREVRNALVYVICNRAKHGGDIAFDPCASTAYLVNGWDEKARPPLARGSPDAWPVAPPETWLVNVAWKRLGLLQAHDAPASKRPRRAPSVRPR